jgi:hypothetical protein
LSCKGSFRNDFYFKILFLFWFCAHILSSLVDIYRLSLPGQQSPPSKHSRKR